MFDNRAVRGVLGAIPGLDAYALLGKAWWHTTEMRDGRPRYDLVIFDGPASGHAALMLRIPQAILNVMPKGPLAGDARAIKELLADPTRAALVMVTLAEDLPARETVELAAQARGALGVPLGPVIVNALPTEALSVPAVDSVLSAWAMQQRGSQATAGDDRLRATLRMAAGVRAHRDAAVRVVAALRAGSRAADDHAAAYSDRRDRPRDRRRADTAPCGPNPIASPKTSQVQLFARSDRGRYRGGGVDPWPCSLPSPSHSPSGRSSLISRARSLTWPPCTRQNRR